MINAELFPEIGFQMFVSAKIVILEKVAMNQSQF